MFNEKQTEINDPMCISKVTQLYQEYNYLKWILANKYHCASLVGYILWEKKKTQKTLKLHMVILWIILKLFLRIAL